MKSVFRVALASLIGAAQFVFFFLGSLYLYDLAKQMGVDAERYRFFFVAIPGLLFAANPILYTTIIKEIRKNRNEK